MKFVRLRRVFGFSLFLCAALGSRAASPGLSTSASAFVRGQADSKVNWIPWEGDWAQRAKTENKPVYVFVGSFLSELSQATCRQSFANAETAEYLNKNFVCVLVDREERPDFAAAAHYYLRIVKQSGGWPVNLWLTPELQPYEGAGYLPPSEEWGKTGFSKAARQAGEAWSVDRAACRKRAKEALAMLASIPPETPPAITPDELERKLVAAAAGWRATFDAASGGFGTAPKLPEPELLRFLLRGAAEDREEALATLRSIRDRALRDPIDGGFFRYASDAAWRLPYPQRTVADQARLALAFLDAHAFTHDERFARTARGALDFALEHFAAPGGGFAAAEDGTADANADYFVWSAGEIDAALGKDTDAFKVAYSVTPEGNVPADDDPGGRYRGKNFLALRSSGKPSEGDAPFASALQRLRKIRGQRPPLPRDDRATAGAYGWMLAALARAGEQLKEPRYLDAAKRTFEWVQKNFVLSDKGDLRRLRDSTAPAAAVDYAALALGCREFARAAHHPPADQLATRLLERAGDLFFDATQGIYLAAPTTLPPGVFVRAPAPEDSLTAESLALIAGAPRAQASALRDALGAVLRSDPPAAGEVLLALRP